MKKGRAKGKKTKRPADWLKELCVAVHAKPVAIFRFGFDEWAAIMESQGGAHRFTLTYPHAMADKVRPPTVCLIFTEDLRGNDACYFARLSMRRPASTLDTWLKIEGAEPIEPATEGALPGLVSDKALKTNLRNRLADDESPVIALSPALSAHLVEKLAARGDNAGTIRRVAAALEGPRVLSRNGALQHDAVKMALGAFGIPADRPARHVEVAGGRETALTRIREDAVIDHDARFVPSFTLRSGDLTGRAVFENGPEKLEVITANTRDLERVLGVDLIYLNVIKQNIVMVQYKMLEAQRRQGRVDWVYRPDAQLQKEIARMKRFSAAKAPGPLEYRINPEVFYLKFVRRDAELGKSAITMPIDHYEILNTDPACKGKRGAFRISYKSLNGSYLRQDPFLELIRAGYIGAHTKTTADLRRLVDAVLKNGRAVVAAIQSYIDNPP